MSMKQCNGFGAELMNQRNGFGTKLMNQRNGFGDRLMNQRNGFELYWSNAADLELSLLKQRNQFWALLKYEVTQQIWNYAYMKFSYLFGAMLWKWNLCFWTSAMEQTALESSKLYWSTVFCFRLQHILTAFGALLLCFEGEYIVLKQ